jgi:uncharacterized protein with FMN-binding domain
MEEQPIGTDDIQAEAPQPPPEKKSTKRRVIFWMVISLVALLVIAALIGGLYAWRFVKAANALTIDDVAISEVPDGTYEGSYSLFHVKASVMVTVEEGRITDIVFLDTGKMTEETRQEIEGIFGEVISGQSLEIDVTSGASASKKVSLKAVEEALTGGD